MKAKKSLLVGIATLFGVGLIALITYRVWLKPEEVVVPNRPIQFDDFAFTVRGVRTAEAIGEGERRLPARGRFTIVTLEVDNRAKRVSYQFKNSAALLVDDEGRTYPTSIAGQNALNAERGAPDPCSAPLPAGTSATTELAFDVPADVRPTRMRLASGGPVGDALEALVFGKRAFGLVEPARSR
jgi:hypothetical protein